MTESQIAHAVVLPDENFRDWLRAIRPYTQTFDRVVIVRSPKGNDLNPYRSISAIDGPPRMWLRDDPVFHIRRIYPAVVRVDLIRAMTPNQMANVLKERINRRDRFGESLNSDNHLFDRFVLDWPTTHRPMRINRPYDDNRNTVSIGIQTVNRSEVIAAVAGTVTRIWVGDQSDELGLGKYVQITTVQDGDTYLVTYGNLRALAVPLHKRVQLGEKVGEANGASFSLMVQRTSFRSDKRLPHVMNPTPMIYIDNLRVRPTVDSLRVRSIPTTDGILLGTIRSYDLIQTRDLHGRVLEKAGVEGEWVPIRMPDGRNGWAAAWFLEATVPRPLFSGVNSVGVNLDQLHPQGKPNPSQLGGIGWVRFGYNVSRGFGSEDIQNAYSRYAPLAEQYARAGYKVIFATSHQTYGEAKGYHWPVMTDAQWVELTARFADMMNRIARQWASAGLVHAWQVWNEQDASPGARSSVPMSAQNYREMLRQVVPAIRGQDNDVFVLTGGHISGPIAGSQYARTAISGLASNAVPDGISIHTYGRGTDTDSIYARFGHIDESLREYTRVMPDKPVWITEWGVLDRPDDAASDIANYATNFISHVKARWSSQVATMIWYAWAQGMDNGYGIVDGNGNPRPSLTERFLNA